MNSLELQENLPPYVNIFESEIRAIRDIALAKERLETGGDLYGLFSHAGRPVIYFASPPGPKAVHGYAHFQQDVKYLKKTARSLRRDFRIQFEGNYHSHQHLGLKSLSQVDLESTYSLAEKNGFRHFCQLLVTFDDPGEGSPPDSKSGLITSWTDRAGGTLPKRFIVRVRAFYYHDGQMVACPLKIIPGVSPIRLALKMREITDLYAAVSSPSPETELDEDLVPDDEADPNYEEAFRDHLGQQIRSLPESAQSQVQIMTGESYLFLQMPFKGDRQLVVGINDHLPFEILGVFLSSGRGDGALVDITEQVLDQRTRTQLQLIYASACQIESTYCFQSNSAHLDKQNQTDKEAVEVNNLPKDIQLEPKAPE